MFHLRPAVSAIRILHRDLAKKNLRLGCLLSGDEFRFGYPQPLMATRSIEAHFSVMFVEGASGPQLVPNKTFVYIDRMIPRSPGKADLLSRLRPRASSERGALTHSCSRLNPQCNEWLSIHIFGSGPTFLSHVRELPDRVSTLGP